MIIAYKLIIAVCGILSMIIFLCNQYNVEYTDKIAIEYKNDLSAVMYKVESKINKVNLESGVTGVSNGARATDRVAPISIPKLQQVTQRSASAASAPRVPVTRESSLRRESSMAKVVPPRLTFNTPSKVDAPMVKADVPPLKQKDVNLVLQPPPVSLGECTTPSILAVGGTDGSGTRRVVWLLTMLGVTMVSEDQQTYDIHADVVGGWPKIVSPVVKATKTFNYNYETLSKSVKPIVTNMVKALLDRLKEDSSKPPSRRLGFGGALPRPWGAHTKGVSYGFKAPISMALFPILPYLLPSVKLLHVVRDGRDIAFSANQGPVTKFYTDMYGGTKDRPEQKGIKLWSDWNSQIYEWAKEYAPTHATTFGYHVLHIEDLVSDSLKVRHTAIYHLASWVGSDLSEQDICCLALTDTEFMGSHDGRTNSKGKGQSANANYGKWKSKLAGNPSLDILLKRSGGEGLEVFGYEPLRKLANDPSYDGMNINGFQCAEAMKMDICKDINDRKTRIAATITAGFQANAAGPAECSYKPGVDYKGGNSDIIAVVSSDQTGHDCCRCELVTCGTDSHYAFIHNMNPGCAVFVKDMFDHEECVLKTSTSPMF